MPGSFSVLSTKWSRYACKQCPTVNRLGFMLYYSRRLEPINTSGGFSESTPIESDEREKII